jgi:Cys-tRNA(Pro)/Cys-tRNA(Cys) deacylase
MTKQSKTNAVRLLEAAGVSHDVLFYDPSDGRIDAAGVAEKLGESPDVLFKTLVARADRNIHVFCIPGNAELNLKKAAQAAGEKKIELVAVKELLPLTGYVRGGCSPLGMKKKYPLFIDEEVLLRDYIIISGGALGVQVRLGPEDLVGLTEAVTADLVQTSGS